MRLQVGALLQSIADQPVGRENRGKLPSAGDGDELAGQRAAGAGAAAGRGRAPVPCLGAAGRAPTAVGVRCSAARRRHSAGDRVGACRRSPSRLLPPRRPPLVLATMPLRVETRLSGIGGIDAGDIRQCILRPAAATAEDECDLLPISPAEVNRCRQAGSSAIGEISAIPTAADAIPPAEQRPAASPAPAHCTRTTWPPLDVPASPVQVDARTEPPERLIVEPISSRHWPGPLPTLPAPLSVIGATGK